MQVIIFTPDKSKPIQYLSEIPSKIRKILFEFLDLITTIYHSLALSVYLIRFP